MDNVIINRRTLPQAVERLLPKRILCAVENADTDFVPRS